MNLPTETLRLESEQPPEIVTSGGVGSTAWEYTVENAIKADAEWWEYRDGCMRLGHPQPYDAACRYVFEKTGRRKKAWDSILPNAQAQR